MLKNLQLERKPVFMALKGSHNYNLNTPESDKDYFVTVLPTFDDLYYGKKYSNSKITDEVDLNIHDVRKLSDLFFKANITYMEVLYSIDFETSNFTSCQDFVEELLNMRDDIVTMNLPYFYRACKGMYHTKINDLDKGTDGTKDLVEKFGFDTKQAQHAYRSLDVAERFAMTGFKDFGGAIRYQDSGLEKEFMMSIKNGEYSKEHFKMLAELKYERFLELEELYINQEVRMDVKEKLDNMIYELVRDVI